MPKLGNGVALVEGVDVEELEFLLNRLKPLGAAEGDVIGFAGAED